MFFFIYQRTGRAQHVVFVKWSSGNIYNAGFLCHLSSRDKHLKRVSGSPAVHRRQQKTYEIKDAMLYRVASANDLQARGLGNC